MSHVADKLTPEQKELFDRENPFWADYLKTEYKKDTSVSFFRQAEIVI